MRRSRLAWKSVAVVLALAGCDAAEDAAGPAPLALVGTWEAEYDLQSDLVTTARTVELVDRTRPGQGGLRFEGAETGAARYLGVWENEQGLPTFLAFSVNPTHHPFPASYAFVSAGPSGVGLTAWKNGTYRQYGTPGREQGPFYTYANGRLTIGRTALAASDGAVVYLEGTLTAPLRTFSPGQEHEAERHTFALDADESVRFVFRADSTFTQTRTQAGQRAVYEGRWSERPGGRVLVSGVFNGQPFHAEADVAREGERVAWGSAQDRCAFEDTWPACLAYFESALGLPKGTLVRVRRRNAWMLRRG